MTLDGANDVVIFKKPILVVGCMVSNLASGHVCELRVWPVQVLEEVRRGLFSHLRTRTRKKKVECLIHTYIFMNRVYTGLFTSP